MIAAGVALLVIVVLGTLVVFHSCWKVTEPNEAALVVGFGASGSGGGYRVVTGGGTLVLPGVQRRHRLQLHEREVDIRLACVTWQGIPVVVRACLLYRVGDDHVSIVNAARRFLAQQDQMDEIVGHVVTGYFRSVAGALTIEQLVFDQEALAERIRRDCGADVERLGLVVDSLTLQEIDDPTGYIGWLAAAHRARIDADARIAEAMADLAAFVAEQQANAGKARARRDAALVALAADAAVQVARATAAWAGPLAAARARQDVLRAEIGLAELQAELADRRLDTTVRRPADARAYHLVTLARAAAAVLVHHAEADASEIEKDAAAHARATVQLAAAEADAVRVLAAADAERTRLLAHARAGEARRDGGARAHVIRLQGRADASRVAARGRAEAAGLAARGAALADNAEAVIAFELARRWPAIVAAAGGPLAAVDDLVVLNGSAGLAELRDQQMITAARSVALVRAVLAGDAAA